MTDKLALFDNVKATKGSLFLIVFMHETEPAVRVIRGTRLEAECSRDRVADLYDDPQARVVEIRDDHDDYDQLVRDHEMQKEDA